MGGYDMVGGRGEELCVWTVTVAGRVMVRQGVTATAPEGTGWMHIPVPAGREVSQISVSPSGKGVLMLNKCIRLSEFLNFASHLRLTYSETELPSVV